MRALEIEVDRKIKVAIRLAKSEIQEAAAEISIVTQIIEDNAGWEVKIIEEHGEKSEAFNLAKSKSLELEKKRTNAKKVVRMGKDEVQRLRQFKKA